MIGATNFANVGHVETLSMLSIWPEGKRYARTLIYNVENNPLFDQCVKSSFATIVYTRVPATESGTRRKSVLRDVIRGVRDISAPIL